MLLRISDKYSYPTEKYVQALESPLKRLLLRKRRTLDSQPKMNMINLVTRRTQNFGTGIFLLEVGGEEGECGESIHRLSPAGPEKQLGAGGRRSFEAT